MDPFWERFGPHVGILFGAYVSKCEVNENLEKYNGFVPFWVSWGRSKIPHKSVHFSTWFRMLFWSRFGRFWTPLGGLWGVHRAPWAALGRNKEVQTRCKLDQKRRRGSQRGPRGVPRPILSRFWTLLGPILGSILGNFFDTCS